MHIPVSRFNQDLIRANSLGLPGFRNWVFHPGMLFGSLCKWWGGQGKRHTAHEGLDLCLYRDKGGNMVTFLQELRIPALSGGEVIGVVDDFLGRSIFIRHPFHGGDGGQLITAYGHTDPLAGIAPGQAVKAGAIIATVRPGVGKGGIMPHLHLSVGRARPEWPFGALGWPAMADGTVTLVDPLALLPAGYEVMGP